MKLFGIFLAGTAIGAIGLAVILLRQPNPIITLENRSRAPLTNVVLSGSGFSAWVGEVATDSKQRISVYPRGESGVRVTFDAKGRHFENDHLGYMENLGGYRMNLAVDADFKVNANGATLGY